MRNRERERKRGRDGGMEKDRYLPRKAEKIQVSYYTSTSISTLAHRASPAVPTHSSALFVCPTAAWRPLSSQSCAEGRRKVSPPKAETPLLKAAGSRAGPSACGGS